MESRRLKRLQEIGEFFCQMLDSDPVDAIARVRSLKTDEYLDQGDVDTIKSSIFIDGGGKVNNPNIVNEGIDLLRALHEKHPERLNLTYNLGNGLSTLAQLKRSNTCKWYLDTSDLRREARKRFESVWSASKESNLRSRAKTNHANLLYRSYRWLEAYELYREATLLDPANAVATSGAAKVLLHAAKLGLGPKTILESLAARYLSQTHAHKDELIKYACPDAIKILDELPDRLESNVKWPPDLSDTDAYTKFVGQNNLALSLTIEGLNPELGRWDSLSIRSIREDMNAEFGVPPIFAMFNVLKADYLAARWIAYESIHNQATESGWYSDTLDYAIYGIRGSLLTLAQRSAIDVLDRIAVAASEYLGIADHPRSIYFRNRWHINKGKVLKKPLEWQPSILDEIEKGNTVLIAISEMAEDIDDGYLAPLLAHRHASTHRFVFLHDFGAVSARKSTFAEHYEANDFAKQTIFALRLVRAALIYFLEMIASREARFEKDEESSVSLDVPPHHWVRGEGRDP